MITKKQALAALDDLDDYVRMSGIEPFGALNVLTKFIEQSTPDKPINCFCGGKAVGKGRCITCKKCTRVVQLPTRQQSVSRWNEMILKELENDK